MTIPFQFTSYSLLKLPANDLVMSGGGCRCLLAIAGLDCGEAEGVLSLAAFLLVGDGDRCGEGTGLSLEVLP